MDREPDSPVAGRAEEHSGSLLLTYFHGDINSMVDAHFSRALRNIYKPKADTVKGKRNGKSAKSEEPSSSSWDVQSGPFRPTYPPEQLHLSRIQEPQIRPRLPQTTPTESSATWAGGPQQGACMVLSPMAYSSAPSVESLMGTGHSYASSLLNLLHSDRPDLNTVMVASSKQEFIPGWTRHMEFRDQAAPDHSCDSGVPMPEKTDVYWY